MVVIWTICAEHLLVIREEHRGACPECGGDRSLVVVVPASRAALPGWFCAHCRLFNGSAKEELTHCRACGRPREEGPPPALDGQ
jgi:hypothetical protein